MSNHYELMDKLDALLVKDGVTPDTKDLIQAFRDHADKVESRLKDLEDLTRDAKRKSMLV